MDECLIWRCCREIQPEVISLLTSSLRLAVRLLWLLGFVGLLQPVRAQFVPLAGFSVDPTQTARLGRTLNLLQNSGPTNHPRVRIVFYGQSITLET